MLIILLKSLNILSGLALSKRIILWSQSFKVTWSILKGEKKTIYFKKYKIKSENLKMSAIN